MRILTLSSLICAALCVVLFLVRMGSAISFSEPLQVVTSGWEQENFLALWRFKEDAAIYTSRFDVPFAWAIYNWLYYVAYGSFVSASSEIFSLGDAWIPTLARLLTFAGVVFAGVLSYLSYSVVLGPLDRSFKGLAVAFAVLVAAGPLVGFWGITTRPDVWAMALEIAGVLVFWRIYRRNGPGAVLAFCVLAYMAWAFKQTNVTAVGAIGLLLLIRRDWRSLILLTVVMLGAWATTLAVGSDIYLRSILLLEYEPIVTIDEAVKILINFAMKFVPGLAIASAFVVIVAISPPLRRAARESWWKEDQAVFPVAGLMVAAVLVLPASTHTGAAENYYFVFSYFLSLFALWSLRKLVVERPNSSLCLKAAIAGWMLQGVAVLVVLTGFAGVLSVRPMHHHFMENKACLDTLPRPLFVDDIYLSLPWMTPGSLPFVLTYNYLDDHKAGMRFERDGVGGMISEGFFAALALPSNTQESFDGASLAGYEHAEKQCPALKIFVRKTSG
jgi:hypothetical protein